MFGEGRGWNGRLSAVAKAMARRGRPALWGKQLATKNVKIVLAIFRQVYILGVLGGSCHGPEAGVPLGARAVL